MLLLLTLLVILNLTVADNQKPNIILIIADDLGRNDVGFHGSNQIPTPNIDALAYNGIILDKFYTQSTCTPSRAALLTGNYPIRMGMQGYPMRDGENRSIPLDMATMPTHLKKLGYKTHLIGKWHLGAAYRRDTPTERGFDTHFGYWNGFLGYYNYSNFGWFPNNTQIYGMDLHNRFEPIWSIKDKYATDLFTEKTLDVIDDHNVDEPLFLMLSHLAPHTGFDGVELGVPNVTQTHLKYSYIKNERRRLYADVVNLLDRSVGQVVDKLAQRKMLENSIILFMADNGAPTVGYFNNEGSNWPFRGIKMSEFEGGVRTAAAIFSPLFKKSGYVSTKLVHVVDLLPTLYSAAGGKLEDLGTVDGINQWDILSSNGKSTRSEILLNIDDAANTSAIIGENLRYKLLIGSYGDDIFKNYYGDSGRGENTPLYDHKSVIFSTTNKHIKKVHGTRLTKEKIDALREKTDLHWCRREDEKPKISCLNKGCLFDLKKDPCEKQNIIKEHLLIAQKLYKRLEFYSTQLVPQVIGVTDPASNPKFYNGTWCTWLDDKLCFKTK